MNPFTAARWGAAGLLVLVLVLIGRGCGARTAQATVFAKDRALLSAGAELRRAQYALSAAAGALRQVDQAAAQAQEAAAERQRQADFAKERALMAAAALKSQMTGIAADLDRAKRDPDCRRLLEATSCASLH
ncbi:hypothetical protein [Lysobacter enzymogenes]|uniref:hypothetical protein n=1 Tax=Lysobacter enzymogenes TaxID=69 RepID=UPI000897966D|nr:hypothetical protein [Lysobacter enzymogenes]SDW94491.1 hypothetical protein SAMN05421681_103298 [Lysobacter enzymogenes]